ncbi:rad52-like protein, partial [Piptocephalis cylindrospora]
GWKMMNLANEVFGFSGWRSEIKTLSVDFIEEREGRVSLAVTSTIRVIIRDGAYREDIGFGSADNVRSKGQAMEKAKKEAVTDGIKRCFRQFGNLMGNCLYDKRYLQSV